MVSTMKLVTKRVPAAYYFPLTLAITGALLLVLYLATTRFFGGTTVVTEQPPAARINRTFTPDTAPLPKLKGANLVFKVETSAPVVFLTMDDGMVKDERVIEFLKRRQWPVSLFLADEYAKDDYDYFKRIAANGAALQNHTLSHRYLNQLTYEEQVTEICSASDLLQGMFGKRPALLRPPGGHYNSSTFAAAKQCGIQAVVMWSAKVDGGQVQFQKGDHLVPGDIVLMHFRPKVMEDLAAFEAEIIKQDLHVARLEDWLHIEECCVRD